ncbi:glucose-1-phosphate adenylyltransferase [Calycomorphotria hydatis]|uniref:Glucose-1-phosphate adenylyltransferase n=1 Tax=Calycomorphotria hydatis TaxID=2528027 RepID=A0A517T827_9PLAN|nr:glucose-1-phosphate adenylyltransferase [Calycomorphotria hydatis]QDT64528.1 Glucose-1-phosphate adenylyltransferase [Calycomorphotria hydatis]
MRNVVSLVLGGGKGTRLFPLTRDRSKPAVPLAGKYRLIDIPISNCLNSDINRIYLITQFNSVSLHRHIRETYKFDRFSGGFVEILAAQQSQDASESDWYQGTADAVRKNLRYVEQPGIDYVAILSGDQLYRMNFVDMLKTHKDSKADATIAATPVLEEAAKGFGLMQLDKTGRVTDFIEKPKTPEALAAARTDPKWIESFGINSKGREYLANMGIYIFNRDMLVDLLRSHDHEDFGKEVFPSAIKDSRVQVHPFDGYWEDIGTIKSFFDANLELASPNPPFEFHSEVAPIYTQSRYLPSSRLLGGNVDTSLIADGCVIEPGAKIENSVIGLRCHIGKNVTIKHSIIMGADYYQAESEIKEDQAAGNPLIGIGDNSIIEGAIIDKNCRVGKNVKLTPPKDVSNDGDFGPIMLRDGILVLPKHAELPDGWSIDKL